MPPERTVLAFDTAAAHCAAVLVSGGERVASFVESMERGQAECLFPRLESLLAGQAVRWRDLGAVGVGTGPGNFTGIRIAVSAARGLAFALRIPAIGITAFERTAAIAYANGTVGAGDRIVTVIDLALGRRGIQVFEAGPLPVALDSPRRIDPGPEASAAPDGKADGPSGNDLPVERDGSLVCAGDDVKTIRADTGMSPEALASLGNLTWRRLEAGRDLRRPLPLYLRHPDAVPAFAR